MDSNTVPTVHWASLQQSHHSRAPQTSKPSPLTKEICRDAAKEGFFNSNANDRAGSLDVHNIGDYSGTDNVDRDNNILPQAKGRQARLGL